MSLKIYLHHAKINKKTWKRSAKKEIENVDNDIDEANKNDDDESKITRKRQGRPGRSIKPFK